MDGACHGRRNEGADPGLGEVAVDGDAGDIGEADLNEISGDVGFTEALDAGLRAGSDTAAGDRSL